MTRTKSHPPVLAIPCSFRLPPSGSDNCVFSYYIDAPKPALIDTGIANSPSSFIKIEIMNFGRNYENINWILCTHGHWDHIGGAYEVKEATNHKAQICLHPDDEHLLQDRGSHFREYTGVRYIFIEDKEAEEATHSILNISISREIGADVLIDKSSFIDLGKGFSLEVISTPGHSAGSIVFFDDLDGSAFVGDAIQGFGIRSTKFPLYTDPLAYRSSLLHLLNDVQPDKIYLSHHFLNEEKRELSNELSGKDALNFIKQSLFIEERVLDAVSKLPSKPQYTATDFSPIAKEFGFSPSEPRKWPGPFFTTISSYLGSGIGFSHISPGLN